jgi:hypothetical protein
MARSFAARLELFGYNNQGGHSEPGGRIAQRSSQARFRPPAHVGRGVTADAGLLAFRPDIEILPLFADRRMDLLAEGDAVERVEHGLAIPLDDASDLRAPSLMLAKPAKGSAKRSMVEWLT